VNRLPLLALLPLLACKPADSTPPAAAPAGAPAPPVAAAAKAAPTHGDHNCADAEPTTVAAAQVTETKDPTTGQTVLQTGAKLAGVAVVSVKDLLQNPEGFAGKTVRLEGNVSAMCVHRRGWFSVQSEDKSGGVIRVLTSPAFLVPEGSIGKRARAEGVVQLVDIPLAQAKHYAEGHGLPVQTKAAVLRATGAEFI
jgi:hypothetical protein